ncbi:MAG: hypothetical protein ACK5M4_01055 [Pseudorhodobacter sp.]
MLADAALLGLGPDDFCGDIGSDYHCPFCRLTPDTPVPAPSDIAILLLPYDAWYQLADLHREAQARDHSHSPRAPPSLI